SRNLARHPEHKLHLGSQSNLSLVVSQDVRRGLEKLRPDQPDIPIDKNVLPGHEDTVENDQRIALIKTGGKRIVKNARLAWRIRGTAVELQPRTVHGKHERQGIILVAGLQGNDTTDKEV